MEDYDEDAELTRYVLNNYLHLMTSFERLGLKAVRVEQKAEIVGADLTELLLRRSGHREDPEIVTALGEGRDSFCIRVSRRVLKEHAEEVFLNRCEECGKLVRTPKARQCLWCGHDWHHEGRGQTPPPQR